MDLALHLEGFFDLLGQNMVEVQMLDNITLPRESVLVLEALASDCIQV